MTERLDMEDHAIANKVEASQDVVEKLLTAQEMADYVGVQPGTIKDWTKLKDNPCPCIRYKSRLLRFEKAEVLAWLKSRTGEWNSP